MFYGDNMDFRQRLEKTCLTTDMLQILFSGYSISNGGERKAFMDNINTFIELKLYETDIEIFGNRDYMIKLYRQPFRRAISNRNTILVRLLLNHITNGMSLYSKHNETRDRFLIYIYDENRI